MTDLICIVCPKGCHLKVDEEKAIKWLMNGAQPTDTVKSLFKELGINQKFLEAKKAAKATK